MFSFIVLAIMTAARNAEQKARAEELAYKARDLGMSFDARQHPGMVARYRFLDRFRGLSGGTDENCLNVIAGEFENRQVTLFDYHYVTSAGSVWWWSPSWKRHCFFSFVILSFSSEPNFPELTIAREGFLSKIAQTVGYRDIDFESHEFSRRYVVRSGDKKFAYDFCNAKMIDYLLDKPIMSVEVEKHVLALVFDDQHDSGLVDFHLRHVAKMRSLMPNYLFDPQPSEA